MATVWYIGDEVSGAGFRLSGARIAVPTPGEEAATFAAACEAGSLILVSSRVAGRIPTGLLARAERALSPLVLIVPDWRDALPVPDRAAHLRAQLGIEKA